jgi:hypothetical protein
MINYYGEEGKMMECAEKNFRMFYGFKNAAEDYFWGAQDFKKFSMELLKYGFGKNWSEDEEKVYIAHGALEDMLRPTMKRDTERYVKHRSQQLLNSLISKCKSLKQG